MSTTPRKSNRNRISSTSGVTAGHQVHESQSEGDLTPEPAPSSSTKTNSMSLKRGNQLFDRKLNRFTNSSPKVKLNSTVNESESSDDDNEKHDELDKKSSQTRRSTRLTSKNEINYRDSDTNIKIDTFGTPDRETRRRSTRPTKPIYARPPAYENSDSEDSNYKAEEEEAKSSESEVSEDSSSSNENVQEGNQGQAEDIICNGRISTKRTDGKYPVKSPYSFPFQTMSTTHSIPSTQDIQINYNPETYFLAPNRIKYKEDKTEKAFKKPRKGNRSGRDRTGDNLPEKRITDFSITRELNSLDLNLEYEPKHPGEIDAIERSIISTFPKWIYLLNEGFNLMLYGYGSKTRVFNEFQRFLQNDFLVIVINGLEPKLNPKQFLLNFWSALDLNVELPSRNGHISALIEDVCKILQTHESHYRGKVFLLVNNLEILGAAQAPRNIMFDVICALSRLQFIHLIGTSDHVNSLLGIEQGKLTGLNLTWINATTFVPYDNEIIWKSATEFGTVDGTDQTAKNTLEHVLKSLTANARKAFGILANMQVQMMKMATGSGTKAKKTKEKEFSGVEFHELARKCREGFIAHSDIRLRTLLAEFIDHKLIRQVGTGKSKGSENLLVIDLDMETLEELIPTLV